MKQNYYRPLVIINFLLVVSIGAYLLYTNSSKKVVYVEISSIYKKFKMTQELEARFTNVTNSRKTFLDSLEVELRSMHAEYSRTDEFERLKNTYIVKKQQFEQDNIQMNQKFNEQIMNQLNQYLVDYGKEKELDFIFGANGNGGIMYANEKAYNVTDDVITYVNKKYAGKLN